MLNPFKALGDMNQMRKKAQEIQQALEKEEFTVTHGNVTILINGNQNVKEVTIDGVRTDNVTRAVNEAIKRSQQAATGKLGDISKLMGM